MKNFRAKPVGWQNESYRHYLAAKGVKTSKKKTAPQKYKKGTIKEFVKTRDEDGKLPKKMPKVDESVTGEKLRRDIIKNIKISLNPREWIVPSEKNEEATARVLYDIEHLRRKRKLRKARERELKRLEAKRRLKEEGKFWSKKQDEDLPDEFDGTPVLRSEPFINVKEMGVTELEKEFMHNQREMQKLSDYLSSLPKDERGLRPQMDDLMQLTDRQELIKSTIIKREELNQRRLKDTLESSRQRPHERYDEITMDIDELGREKKVRYDHYDEITMDIDDLGMETKVRENKPLRSINLFQEELERAPRIKQKLRLK